MHMSVLFKTLLTMVRDGCERDKRSVMFYQAFVADVFNIKYMPLWGTFHCKEP